jgi:hypothetical protein
LGAAAKRTASTANAYAASDDRAGLVTDQRPDRDTQRCAEHARGRGAGRDAEELAAAQRELDTARGEDHPARDQHTP